MLPPFIIDQVRQREERERERDDESRSRLELPLEPLVPRTEGDSGSNEDDPDRGVVIVDLLG